MSTLFSSFLTQLGVRHTESFSDKQYRGMSFSSLFGLSRLLDSYGVANATYQIKDKNELLQIPTPFLAQRNSRFVIVRSIDRQKGASEAEDVTVTWDLFDKVSTSSATDFLNGCSGIVMQAYPDSKSIEPDYAKHHFYDLAAVAKKWLLIVLACLAVVYGFIASGLWHEWHTIALTVVDLAGLGVTWLLVLKSLKVKSKTADRVCGVLQEHGCDHVLENKASSFFGLFNWSDVGIAYFSVSTLALILFPDMLPQLALINVCCLPFTIWSITYQKFVIKTWCTLCVITQALLWCQFVCYLPTHWWTEVWPLQMPIFVLIAVYGAVMLAVNRVCSFILNRDNN